MYISGIWYLEVEIATRFLICKKIYRVLYCFYVYFKNSKDNFHRK